jgi:hypothetical protein
MDKLGHQQLAAGREEALGTVQASGGSLRLVCAE